MKIWDGSSKVRKDLNSSASPKFEDYLAIVEQMQETQRFLSNLSENMAVMPDLAGKLTEADTKISEVNAKLAQLALPVDLMTAFDALKQSVEAGDQSSAIRELQNAIELQSRKTTEVRLQAEQMLSVCKEDVRGAKNIARLATEKLRADTEIRLGKIEQELVRLNRLLTIKAELDAINKV